jgi:hypothetical protein
VDGTAPDQACMILAVWIEHTDIFESLDKDAERLGYVLAPGTELGARWADGLIR